MRRRIERHVVGIAMAADSHRACRQTKLLGSDLAECRDLPGADIHRRGGQIRRTVAVDLDDRPRMLVDVRETHAAANPDRVHRKTETALLDPFAAWRRPGRRPVDLLGTLPQAILKTVSRERKSRIEWMRLALLTGILQTHLDRVEAKLGTDFIDLRFNSEAALRRAITAETSADHIVGIDRETFPFGVRRGVVEEQAESAVHHDHLGTVRGVGAAVEDTFGIARREGAVLLDARLQVHLDRVARCGDEVFQTRLFKAHGTTSLLAQQRGDRLHRGQFELAAESAADIGRLDDLYLAFGQAERECKFLACTEDVLGRNVDGDVVLTVHIDDADARFHIAGMDALSFIDAFENEVGIGKAFFEIAGRERRILRDVVCRVGMQLRRARLHGLLGIEHCRQFLVLDVDQIECRLGNFDCRRSYRSHRLANVTHDFTVHHLEIEHHAGRLHRDEEYRAELDLRHVLGQQNRLHTGQSLGARSIDADNARMRIRTAQHLGMQHSGQAHIDRVALAARHLVIRIGPLNAVPDDIHLVHCIVP